MYTVYADDICIYNTAFVGNDAILISPVLNLEESAAGSFEFTIPTSNKAYNSIERLKTEITVKRDGIEIWSGRVLTEEKDFWDNRKLYCEGELAYLNDTTQPMGEYHDLTPRQFLETLIENHNDKVTKDKRFYVGVVTVTDPNNSLYRYTNLEKTIECINDKLVSKLGGYIRVRKEDGIRYIDYLKSSPKTSTQTINFGSNLMDFVRSWDETEYATVVLPLGAQLEESPIEALEAYLNVKTVNRGSEFVQNESAVKAFGWIEKVVHWDDVTVPANLLRKAKTYLTDLQFDNMTIEVSALDLNYLDNTIESIGLSDRIQVISPPHGLNRIFPVKKLQIPLDSPENTLFTLGDVVRTSLTGVNNETSAAILDKIDKMPTRQSVLAEAKRNAKAIMDMKTTGYITIVEGEDGYSDALYISESEDYKHSQKYWRFSMNGLGYTEDGGEHWGIAITMDGQIVADFITAGTMSADRVRTGILRSINDNLIFDLDNGTLTMKAGSININNKFIVDTSGNLTAKNITANGNFVGGDKTSENFWIELTRTGKLTGGKGSNVYGYIDYTAKVKHTDDDTYDYGIKMASDWLYLSHNGISVRESNNDELIAHKCQTKTLHLVTGVETDGHGSITRVTSNDFEFVHGFLVKIGSFDS